VIALAVIATAELVLIAFLIMRHTAQIDRLCQRIQAPHAAILEHDEKVRERRSDEFAPPAIEPDDDDAYWMSRDKLADMAMKAEMDERPAA
jgi:hypothetical protein